MKRPKIMTMTPDQLADWNEIFPVGSPCLVIEDDRRETASRTTTPAWLLGNGQPVVGVDGKSGGWALDRVKMMETHRA